MRGGTDNQGPSFLRRVLVPAFILFCGLAATAMGTYLVADNLRVRNRQHLLEGIHQIEQTVESRMEAYISLLRGGAGVFAAKELVSQAEFKKFYDRLEIPSRYPGMQGYGYSLRLPAEKLQPTVLAARRQGMTNFHVWPEGARPEYHAIIYLEPEDERNRRALGFDMSTDSARRQAMEAARDSGNAAVSGKVKLVQELQDGSAQPGFLLYVPIYFGGEVPGTPERRREALQGFIYSPFRAGNLFSAMLPSHLVPGLGFAIWDGTNCVPENLLYQSDLRLHPDLTFRQREIAGRTWTIGFSALPGFGKAPGGGMLMVIPLFGILASGLLSSLAYREGKARFTAEENANALVKQREWLDVTLASIVDAVITTDTFGRLEFMNGAAEEITGESLPNVRGRPIAEFFSITDEDTGRPLGNPAEKVLSSGEVVRFSQHVLLRTRQGREKSIDPSAAPLRDRNQELVGAVLVFRETTERRKYERRSTAQHAVTAILSESESLTAAIPRLLETIGTQLQFQIGTWWRFNDAAGRAEVGAVWQAKDSRLSGFAQVSETFHLAKGEGLPGRVWNARCLLYLPDLQEAADLERVQRALAAGLKSMLVFPVLTERTVYGAVEFITRESLQVDPELQNVFQGLGRQIGQFIERKQSEQALSESEELYRAITENAADGVIVIDEDSTILAINPAVERIFGYTAGELCGQCVTGLMAEQMQQAHRDGIQRYVASGQKTVNWGAMEVIGRRRDGTEIPIEISLGAARRNGKFLFTALLRDITERKRAEQAIRELNQELEIRVERRTAALLESKEQMESFTYTVAHDLRAPLRAMQGFAHALLDDYAPALAEDGRDYLKRIMSSAERMDVLIQDLLAYSQLSRSDLNLGSINLKELVDATVAEHEHEIAEKRAKLTVTIPDFQVIGHSQTLQHALSNLISNALKFTRPGTTPQIEIAAEMHPPFIRLCVIDNGIGIAREHHDRIFRVFERLHGQEDYPGTGIGLAIVRKGVERMGGRVGLRSHPGEGATFWVDLRTDSNGAG